MKKWSHSHNHLLNPILAEVKKMPVGVNTTIELQNTKILPIIPAHLLVEIYLTRCHYCYTLRSIAVLTPYGQFLDCANIAFGERITVCNMFRGGSILESLPAFVFKAMIMNLHDLYYKIRRPLSMGLLFTEPHIFHTTDHCDDNRATKL